MKGILLITVTVSVALVYGYNSGPCQTKNEDNAYGTFVWKHILERETFDRTSKTEWSRYLRQKKLCHRPRQTFMEKEDLTSVVRICNGHGWRLYPSSLSSLCISDSLIWVHQLEVGEGCGVTDLETYQHYVIVTCDIVVNQCLPVHYEEYRGETPDTRAPRCRP